MNIVFVVCFAASANDNGAVLGTWGLVEALPWFAPTAAPTSSTMAPSPAPSPAPTWTAATSVLGCNTSHYFENIQNNDTALNVPTVQLLSPVTSETMAYDSGILYALNIKLWQAQYTTIVHRLRTYPSVPLYHFIEVVPSLYSTSVVTVKSHVCDHVIEQDVSTLVVTNFQRLNYKSQLFKTCGNYSSFNVTCAASAFYEDTSMTCACANGETYQSSTSCVVTCAQYGGCVNGMYAFPTGHPTPAPTTTASPTSAPPANANHVFDLCKRIYPTLTDNTTVLLGNETCVYDPSYQWCNLGAYWTLTNYTNLPYTWVTTSWDPTSVSTDMNSAIVTALAPYIESAFKPANVLPVPPCICAQTRQPYWSRSNELVRLVDIETEAPSTSPTAAPSQTPTTFSPTAAPVTTSAPTSLPTLAPSIPFPVFPGQCDGVWAYCFNPVAIYCNDTTTYPTCNKNIVCDSGAKSATDDNIINRDFDTDVYLDVGNYGCGTATDTPYDLDTYGVKTWINCGLHYNVCYEPGDPNTILTEYCISSVSGVTCDETNACNDGTLLTSFLPGVEYAACTASTGAPTLATTAPTSIPTAGATTLPPSVYPTVYYEPWDNEEVVMVRNFWDVAENVAYLWNYDVMGPILLVHVNESSGEYLEYIETNHGLSGQDVLMPSAATCTGTPGCTPLINPYRINVQNTSNAVYQCLWVNVIINNPPNANGPLNVQIDTEWKVNQTSVRMNSVFLNLFFGTVAWQATFIKLAGANNTDVASTVSTVLDQVYWTPWVNISTLYLDRYNMDTVSNPLNCRGMDAMDCRPNMTWYGSFEAWFNSRAHEQTRQLIVFLNTDTWLFRFITNNSQFTPLFPELEVISTSPTLTFTNSMLIPFRLQFTTVYQKAVIQHNSVQNCQRDYTEALALTGQSANISVQMTESVSTCSTTRPCLGMFGGMQGCSNIVPMTKSACNNVPLCFWCLQDTDSDAPTSASLANLTFPPTPIKATEALAKVNTMGMRVAFGVLTVIVFIFLLLVVCIASSRIVGTDYSRLNGS